MPSFTHSERADRRNKMARDVLEGIRSIDGTGSFYRVSSETVRKACKEAGVDLSLAQNNLSSRIIRSVQAGEKIEALCLELGVDSDRIRETCNRSRISLNESGKSNGKTIVILADLINTTDPMGSIAKRHGVSYRVVNQIYLKASASNIPVLRRRSGPPTSAPVKLHPVIVITLDDAIDDRPDFFRLLTSVFNIYADIHIVASKRLGSEEAVRSELSSKLISFQSLVLTDDVAEYVREVNADVLIDNRDENIVKVPPSVLVLKVRDDGNFCFVNRHWMYSSGTGENV